MQIVHATFRPGEGEKAVSLLDTLCIDIEDYKLIKSESGDLVIINLLYGNIDILVDSLTSHFDFTNDEERSLIIFTPDAVIPRNEKKLKEASFHDVRESLLAYAQDNSTVNFQYLMLVIASAIISVLGLILDNVAVIVGSMVIAPLLGPILAVTIGIILGNARLIRKGVSAEIIGIIFAVFVGFVFSSIIPNVEITDSLRVRMFPTLADLFIATAAGTAAAYSIIKEHLQLGLVGVMVAASLLPVMSTIGVGISLGNQTMILGAFLLLGGNYLGLFLSILTVFYFEGLKPQTWYKDKAENIIKKSIVFIIIAFLLLSIPLGILTIYQFYIEKPIEIIKHVIRDNLASNLDYRVEKIEIKGNLIDVYIYTEKELDREILYRIKRQIETNLAQEYNIVFRVIPIKEISI